MKNRPNHALVALALCAGGLAHAQDQLSETKPIPVPPQMEDVKTPPPPAPIKEPLSPADSAARAAAVVEMPAKSTAHEVGRGYLAGIDPTQVYFDAPGDGRIWAAANAYKAGFGAEGATYIPFLGSRAPQNYPIRITIRSIRAGTTAVPYDAAALPTRAGNRIVFDRGIVDEIYDLSPESMEQSFVIDTPLSGEIVIELAVETELARSADAQGLVFTTDLGSVRYTNAVAVDADGVRSAAPTAWNASDAIEIRVPADRVAAARFPLVVDPFFGNFNVDTTATQDDSSPDVSYDVSADRWLAVYERAFSATDHDVYSRFFSSTGNLISVAYIDAGPDYWADPKVANNNLANQFLCVAEVGSPSGNARTIRGRTREAGGAGIVGNPFTINGAENGEKYNPDVGGDPSLSGPTYYCVVWERDFSSIDSDIHARLVETNGTTFGSTIYLSNPSATLDYAPSLPKGNGAGPFFNQFWNVAWTRVADTFDSDLYGARIDWDGTVTSDTFQIDTTATNTVDPSVATALGAPGRYLIVYTVAPFLGDPDIWGKLMGGTSPLDTRNLTALSGAPDAERQVGPSADSDGDQFVVANAETHLGSTTDYDIFVSTFSIVGLQLAKAEGHIEIAGLPYTEDEVEIACPETSGGPDDLAFAVFHEANGSGNGDIGGALYQLDPRTSFCTPGSEGVIVCPCGNAPSGVNRGCNNSSNTGGARLIASGGIFDDDILLTATSMLPSALCIFTQGDGVSTTGSTFGDGVRCAAGQILRLGTKTASLGQASYPSGGDLSILERAAALGSPIGPGSKRYYYTYYRDQAAFACASTFNSTNAVMVQW